MDNLLRERVRERLTTLEMNPFEAARIANFERSFVNDLLIGKKTTVRQSKLPALAKALDCDPEYLIGLQGTPRAGEGAGVGSLRLAGIVEAGAWRTAAGTLPPRTSLPLAPDPRYPAPRQVAFLVRGDHAAGLGITDGSVVTVLLGPMAYRDGDIVVARRVRNEQEEELSIRVLAGGTLIGRPLRESDQEDVIPQEGSDIVGLLVAAHRVFGSAV
jgi:transcriptional regulator with XRE-family HTH domain